MTNYEMFEALKQGIIKFDEFDDWVIAKKEKSFERGCEYTRGMFVALDKLLNGRKK